MDSQTTCPNCGATIQPGARFCGSCGQSVPAAPVAGAGFGPAEGQPSTPPAPWEAQPAQTPPPPPPATGPMPAGPFIPTSTYNSAPGTPPPGAGYVPPKKKSKTGLYVGIGCLALVLLVGCVVLAFIFVPKIMEANGTSGGPSGGSVTVATVAPRGSTPSGGAVVVPTLAATAAPAATPRGFGSGGSSGGTGTVATPVPQSNDGIERGELLYSDDFSDDESGWDIREGDDASTIYEDGAYHIIVNDIDWVAWGNPYNHFDDAVVDVDATQVSGPDDNDFGVLLRYVDVDNFYRFEISGDGYYSFDLMQDNEWITLIDWTESAAINQGDATNTITVVCDGDLFTFYVNGEYLDEYSDGTFPSGDVGLLAGTIEEGPVHIAFDNMAVWALP